MGGLPNSQRIATPRPNRCPSPELDQGQRSSAGRSGARVERRALSRATMIAIMEAGKDTGHPTEVQWRQGVSSFQ